MSPPKPLRHGPGAIPVTSATKGSHSTVSSSAESASRPESPVRFTTETAPGATCKGVASSRSTGPAALWRRACVSTVAVAFGDLGVAGVGAGAGVGLKGSFGPEPPWMMGRLELGPAGVAGTGRTGGRAPPAGGASNGEPVAFGDSGRVLRPENETLFSVPTQIGIRSCLLYTSDAAD